MSEITLLYTHELELPADFDVACFSSDCHRVPMYSADSSRRLHSGNFRSCPKLSRAVVDSFSSKFPLSLCSCLDRDRVRSPPFLIRQVDPTLARGWLPYFGQGSVRLGNNRKDAGLFFALAERLARRKLHSLSVGKKESCGADRTKHRDQWLYIYPGF